MEISIYWTEFSETTLREIFEYYRERVSYAVGKALVDGIYEETQLLKHQPEIGQIEVLLKGRKEEFRYLVYKNYKIIYWINHRENRIEINDVFDTRQNPREIFRKK